MKDGGIIESGIHDERLDQGGFYAELYRFIITATHLTIPPFCGIIPKKGEYTYDFATDIP
jgi:hypothetical protein